MGSSGTEDETDPNGGDNILELSWLQRMLVLARVAASVSIWSPIGLHSLKRDQKRAQIGAPWASKGYNSFVVRQRCSYIQHQHRFELVPSQAGQGDRSDICICTFISLLLQPSIYRRDQRQQIRCSAHNHYSKWLENTEMLSDLTIFRSMLAQLSNSSRASSHAQALMWERTGCKTPRCPLQLQGICVWMWVWL